MEFGKVPEDELEKADFRLKPDPGFNKKILKGKPVRSPKVYIGCAKWGRPEWVGKLYPAGTREKDFLDHYVEHYNSIELNATHYRIYGAAAVAKWTAKTGGSHFVFCPKMYQGITHRGRLTGKNFITAEFLRGIMTFEKHLGPIFIQLNELFTPKRKQELFDFLRSLPKDLQFFVEVRHPDWFVNETVTAELMNTLRTLKTGIIITDTAGRRDCVHMYLTIPKTFIRFTGNSLHPTDFTRIDEWVARMKHWLDKGLKELYFFLHMHEEGFSPELSAYLVDTFNAATGMHLQKPELIAFNNKP